MQKMQKWRKSFIIFFIRVNQFYHSPLCLFYKNFKITTKPTRQFLYIFYLIVSLLESKLSNKGLSLTIGSVKLDLLFWQCCLALGEGGNFFFCLAHPESQSYFAGLKVAAKVSEIGLFKKGPTGEITHKTPKYGLVYESL